MEITIYDKRGAEVASVTVSSSSYVFTQIMGEHYLQLDFRNGEYIDIRRDSYVMHDGIKYTLIKAANVEKISTVEYSYSVRFDAPQELLENIMMTHMAGENQVTTKAYERDFSLAGTALEHLEMLQRNTDRLKVNFHVGSIDASLTGVKVVAYNCVSCKSALQLIANAFETEWWVDGNETDGYTLNLGKCSFDEDSPTQIAYGFDNGVLPNSKRQLHKDAQRMSHICVQGGSDNINTLSQLEGVPAYGFSTLHLPLIVGTSVQGVGQIKYDVKNRLFEGETGFVEDNAVLLTIDRNANTMTSNLYAEGDVVVERAYDMSEFYPQATRTVTSVQVRSGDDFRVGDDSIEEACDYNTYQLGGEKMTIVFQTGALAGKTFDILEYWHDSRKFKCKKAEYDTITMPSREIEMWQPAVGDKFIVYGCALPISYFHNQENGKFTGAEWDMCRRTASILCENFEDKYAYSLTIDSNWLSRRSDEQRQKLRCGYWVHYVDNQLVGGGIDIRITDVKQYLTRPLSPELTVGDEVKTISVAQRLTQIKSEVSATYNYVTEVKQETQQAIQSAMALPIDTEFVQEELSDERTPSTKLVYDSLYSLSEQIFYTYATKKALEDYAKSTDVYTRDETYSKTQIDLGLQIAVSTKMNKSADNCTSDAPTNISKQLKPWSLDKAVDGQFLWGGSNAGGWYAMPLFAMSDYVKTKLATVASSGSYSDLEGKPTIPTDYAVSRTIQSGTDLNTITTAGVYNCGGNHGCANAPSTSNPFGMIVVHTASGSYYAQILFDYWGEIYLRYKGGSNNTWREWKNRKADWNETNQYSPAYINNKPKIWGRYQVTLEEEYDGTDAIFTPKNFVGGISVYPYLNNSRTVIRVAITDIANTQEAYNLFMRTHRLEVTYAYLVNGSVKQITNIVNTNDIVYDTIEKKYMIHIGMNGSLLKNPNPTNYITVTFHNLV